MGQPVVHFEVIGQDAEKLHVPGGPTLGQFTDPEGRLIGVVGAA